ncbi:MAG: MmgE/PrpD family protein [Alphaproteobacteria bacterium]|nr:MmgE/PrpD family protein [Alphaproteobacteria bacterium]
MMRDNIVNRRVLLGLFAGLAVAPASAGAAPATGKSATGEAPLAQRLADYVFSASLADLDAATVERAKVHLLDSLGCGIAAFEEPTVRAVRELALANGGNAATIIGTGRQASLEWAAFANGAGIRADDINDFYVGRQNAHPSDNIACCLAAAQAANASGAEFLLAMLLAYEIECRFLDAGALDDHGWDHPNYALISGALAAGRLMKLSPPQLAEAVNLALSGHVAMDQTRLGTLSNWKGLAGPEAARNAIFAVQLARAGITGPSPIFEGAAGFFKQVSGPLKIDTKTFGGRGRRFRIHDCFIKSYPAQAQTQTAIPAAAKVAGAVGDLSRIRSIEVKSTHMGWLMAGSTPERWAPRTSETADHSLPYIVARAMLDRTITPASYSPGALRDPKAAALLRLITVHEDSALTAMAPRQPNSVTATLDDGRVITERVDDLPGFSGRPMQREDAEAKFQRNAKSILKAGQIERISESVWSLDRAASVSDLIKSMIITTSQPSP